jgi:hypothetical protein
MEEGVRSIYRSVERGGGSSGSGRLPAAKIAAMVRAHNTEADWMSNGSAEDDGVTTAAPPDWKGRTLDGRRSAATVCEAG